MRRRLLCKEQDLCFLICELNKQLQTSPGYSATRRAYVTRRRVLELVELMPAPPGAKKPNDNEDIEYGGRISGSLAWRTSRGETQVSKSQTNISPRFRPIEFISETRGVANLEDIARSKYLRSLLLFSPGQVRDYSK